MTTSLDQEQSTGLTVAQAARELGYANPMTIYNKVRDGSLRARYIGKWVRIHPEDNAELWEERRALRAEKSV